MSPKGRRPLLNLPIQQAEDRKIQNRGGCSSSAACSTRGQAGAECHDHGLRAEQGGRACAPSLSRMYQPSPSARRAATARVGSGLDAPRTSSSRYDQFGAAAIAPGYGVGWVELDPDADRARPPTSRSGPSRSSRAGSSTCRAGLSRASRSRSDDGSAPIERDQGGLLERLAEVLSWWSGTSASGLPAWPRPAITDAEGRFTSAASDRDLRVELMVHDPRFARTENRDRYGHDTSD